MYVLRVCIFSVCALKLLYSLLYLLLYSLLVTAELWFGVLVDLYIYSVVSVCSGWLIYLVFFCCCVLVFSVRSGWLINLEFFFSSVLKPIITVELWFDLCVEL